MLPDQILGMIITVQHATGPIMLFFYAASALLYSKGKIFSKHSAVIAAFRQYFIKTGEFDKKWSDVYEYIMSSRHTGDYELYDHLEKEQVIDVVKQAQSFVEEVEKWLRKQDLL
jgi:uncharacterized protein (UPF0332 family)